MNNYILEFQGVWKTFGKNKIKLDALKRIDFKIKKNSLNIILGPSGSGKSTLLNLVSLLDTPTKGNILIKEKDASKMSQSERSKFRRKEIGIIYQRDNLFPYLNILENVMVPMVMQNKEEAVKILKMIGLDDINKFPDEISVEDQQKVALARALINNPSFLLADEPTGELNSGNAVDLINLIKSIGSNCTVLIASNNLDLFKYCDNMFYLKDGILNEK
jgi:putative ABC transport system ATP-binding protein